MGLIVQKFGGTSVKSAENRKAVLGHILRAKEKGYDVVVVVSAMGRMGDPYATDTLIELLKAQGDKVCPKTQDLIMSCGEIISACVMASYLEAQGIKAEAVTGFQAGIVTTEDFGNADIIKVDPEPITEKLREGKVVVVAGFQGRTEKNDITTLGRGGSDTTAVVLGGYLKADFVEIYTDVPGIAVTDPRVVPEALFIPQISYEEVISMAENGAKVIHPRAVIAAKKFNLQVRVKSTFDESDGTLVGPEASDLIVSGISITKGITMAKYEGEKAFTNDDITKLQRLSKDKTIYDDDARQKVILIDEADKDAAKSLAKELNAQVAFFDNMSKVSAVYENTINSNIIDEKITSSLCNDEVQLIAKKVLTNYNAYIVEGNNAEKSVRAIYKAFFS
ncbi:MAG: aspartate kinase [Thermoanaerobacteraceae bacterium]|nr:aspartate kinase [Thermoanaerobacteraceae bacterium]